MKISLYCSNVYCALHEAQSNAFARNHYPSLFLFFWLHLRVPPSLLLSLLNIKSSVCRCNTSAPETKCALCFPLPLQYRFAHFSIGRLFHLFSLMHVCVAGIYVSACAANGRLSFALSLSLSLSLSVCEG